MPRTSSKAKYIDEVKRLYINELRSLNEIRQALGPSVQTLSRWLGEEGIELAARPRDPNKGRSSAAQAAINERVAASQRARIGAGGHHGGRSRRIERETRACANPACSATFEVPVTSRQRFCGMTCARSISNKERWAGKRQMTTCPCGKEFYSPYAKKYCSNECSAKHTRTKQHIVVEDAIVLDSGFEALFWGLCSLWKLPVERADRNKAVEVGDNGWYCPDFYLPTMNIWVEVKGYEDDDDRARYAAWAAQGEHLTVLDRNGLLLMRAAKDERDFASTIAAIVPASRRVD